MTSSKHVTLNADEIELLESGLVTPLEFLDLSQSELDSLKLIQKFHSEVVARLTAPPDPHIGDGTTEDFVE